MAHGSKASLLALIFLLFSLSASSFPIGGRNATLSASQAKKQGRRSSQMPSDSLLALQDNALYSDFDSTDTLWDVAREHFRRRLVPKLRRSCKIARVRLSQIYRTVRFEIFVFSQQLQRQILAYFERKQLGALWHNERFAAVRQMMGGTLLISGSVLSLFGVCLWFDKSMIRLGHLLFLAGLPMAPDLVQAYLPTSRPRESDSKRREVACLVLGLVFVFLGRPLIGLSLETWSFLSRLDLFAEGFTDAFLQKIPFSSDDTSWAAEELEEEESTHAEREE